VNKLVVILPGMKISFEATAQLKIETAIKMPLALQCVKKEYYKLFDICI